MTWSVSAPRIAAAQSVADSAYLAQIAASSGVTAVKEALGVATEIAQLTKMHTVIPQQDMQRLVNLFLQAYQQGNSVAVQNTNVARAVATTFPDPANNLLSSSFAQERSYEQTVTANMQSTLTAVGLLQQGETSDSATLAAIQTKLATSLGQNDFLRTIGELNAMLVQQLMMLRREQSVEFTNLSLALKATQAKNSSNQAVSTDMSSALFDAARMASSTSPTTGP
jgi:hypothetical protein